MASFTRTEGDLEVDTLRPGHLVTGPFIARYLHICNINTVSIISVSIISLATRFSRGQMTGHVWWAVLGGGWLHGQVGT